MITSQQQFCRRRGEACILVSLPQCSYPYLGDEQMKAQESESKLQPRKTGVVVVLVGFTLAPPAGFSLLNHVSVQGFLKAIKSADLTNSQWEPGGVLIVRTILSVFISGIACVVKEIFKAKRSSISREPRFVFFVRLKPLVREGNVVGIISRDGW